MKGKWIIVTVLLAFFSSNILAQKIKIGIKGGANVSTLNGDFTDVEYKLSYHVGAFMNFHASNLIVLQPEIIYSDQGAIAKTGNDEFNLRYLNVPLIVKIGFSEKFNFQIGPQVGILLFAKTDDGSEVIDYTKFIADTDLALCAGFGFRSTDNVTIDLRYHYGITNLAPKDVFPDDFTFHNQVIQLSLGIIFN